LHVVSTRLHGARLIKDVPASADAGHPYYEESSSLSLKGLGGEKQQLSWMAMMQAVGRNSPLASIRVGTY